HDICKVRKAFSCPADYCQKLERREHAVPCGIMIKEYHMPGLLSPKVIPTLAHLLDNITVTHICLDDLAPGFPHRYVKPHVAHDRCDQSIFPQFFMFDHISGTDGHNLVSVHLVSILVHENDPVCVSIQSNSEVGAMDLDRLAHHFRMERAAPGIDVRPVRLHPYRYDLRSQLFEHSRCNLVGGTIGTVENDLHPRQIKVLRKSALEKHDVTSGSVIYPVGLSYLCSDRTKRIDLFGEQELFNLQLDIVGKLEPVLEEKLYSVVLKSIMGCRDHYSGICPHRRSDIGYTRSRERSYLQNIDPH